MTYKVIAIKWRTSADLAANRKTPTYEEHYVEETELIPTISSWFYDRKSVDQCLIKYKNQLWICDRSNEATRQYHREVIEYHPLAYLLD